MGSSCVICNNSMADEGNTMTYESHHALCGLTVGDTVRVTRRPEDFERGWQGGWDKFCDMAIGKEFEIMRDEGEYGFVLALHLRGSLWVYPRVPCFVLEKVGEVTNDAA